MAHDPTPPHTTPRVYPQEHTFEYTGTTTHPSRIQELPAVFVVRRLSQLMFYDGDKPWTGGMLQVWGCTSLESPECIPPPPSHPPHILPLHAVDTCGPCTSAQPQPQPSPNPHLKLTPNNHQTKTPAFPNENFYMHENWAAYVDPVTKEGVGVWVPWCSTMTAYRVGLDDNSCASCDCRCMPWGSVQGWGETSTRGHGRTCRGGLTLWSPVPLSFAKPCYYLPPPIPTTDPKLLCAHAEVLSHARYEVHVPPVHLHRPRG